MKIYKESTPRTIVNGSSTDILKQHPNNCIDCCITSPPYWGLRDYGVRDQIGIESSIDCYLQNLMIVFDEVFRVLKDRGSCWVNLGDCYSRNAKTQKRLLQIPSRFAIEMGRRGWILRNEIIWHKPNAMPCSAKDRFTVDFEKVFFFTKQKSYYFKQQFEPRIGNDIGGFHRSRTRGYRSKFKKVQAQHKLVCKEKFTPSKKRNQRCVWNIPTKSCLLPHPAIFPEKLVERMIRAGCPEKGKVMDPFCGSGTTLVVAQKMGRDFFGIDLNLDYVNLAQQRIKAWTKAAEPNTK